MENINEIMSKAEANPDIQACFIDAQRKPVYGYGDTGSAFMCFKKSLYDWMLKASGTKSDQLRKAIFEPEGLLPVVVMPIDAFEDLFQKAGLTPDHMIELYSADSSDTTRILQ